MLSSMLCPNYIIMKISLVQKIFYRHESVTPTGTSFQKHVPFPLCDGSVGGGKEGDGHN